MPPKMSSARFLAEKNDVQDLIANSRFREAYQAATQLLKRSDEAGPDAYNGAGLHNALARILVGQTMLAAGDASSALHPLADAQRQVDALITEGEEAAAPLAYVVRGLAGDAMKLLGRHTEALALYEQASQRTQELDQFVEFELHKVDSLVATGQTERALAVANAVVSAFNKLGRPDQQAEARFRLGEVHEQTRDYAAAEEAYRQALAIAVRAELSSQEGKSLTRLGILYDKQERLEDAANFYRRAADVRRRLKDPAGLGNTLSDLGNTLRKLRRWDEARQVLSESIKLKLPLGNAGQRWIPWGLLAKVENAAGDRAAARKAHKHALAALFEYRAAGGEVPRNPITALCPQAFHAIRQGKAAEMDRGLDQLFAAAQADPAQTAYLTALRATLRGSRDEQLAFAPDLDYLLGAEILLLIKLLVNGPSAD